MSSSDVKEIVYHCQCRRFAEGTPAAPTRCPECGREHVPGEDNLVSGSGAAGAEPEVT